MARSSPSDGRSSWRGDVPPLHKDIVMKSVQHLLKHQSQLLPEQSEHLMRRMVNNNNQILAEIHVLKARDEEIPSELPPPLPSNLSLQARKQKGSTRKRALTGAEASEHQQKAMTRAQTRARAAREVQSTQEGVAVTFKRHTRSQKDADLLEDQLQKDTANRVRLSELDVLIRLPGDRPSNKANESSACWFFTINLQAEFFNQYAEKTYRVQLCKLLLRGGVTSEQVSTEL
ncbi:MAG: hypothetical protein M1840_001202 [Geoglossum simile]|nr:MAG: hypothetical protein M1840_001202 [Geoglossum simile]